MPLQNMPLWHKDNFGLKEIEKKQNQKSFKSPHICLKVECKFVKVAPLYQEEQTLITGDSFRSLPSKRWHEKNPHSKHYQPALIFY